MNTARRSYGVYQPRSRARALGDAVANLREGFARVIGETILRFAGMILLTFNILALLALASYDAADPSLNAATGRAAANWLGVSGAYGADLMLQAFGVCALALILPLMAWGWRLATGGAITKPGWRLAALVLGTIFLAAAFGALPLAGQLPAGAGGVLGQVALLFIGKVAHAFAQSWLSYAVPVLFAAFGFTLSWVASGIRADPALRTILKAARLAARLGRHIAAIPMPIWRRKERYAADDDEEIEDLDEDFNDPSMLGISPEPFAPRDSSRTGRVQRAEEKKRKMRPKGDRQPALNLAAGEYQLPPLGFLNEPPAETAAPKFSDDALHAISTLAIERKIGARGLRLILEDLMLDVMYELPSQKKVKEFVITKEMVENKEVVFKLLEKAG